MEREDRPTTADIAARDAARDEGDEAERDQDLGDTARSRDEVEEQEQRDARGPLLAEDATSDFQTRWREIQAGFVDEPRRAVENADTLVAELMQRLADSFAEERSRLESQWDRGDDVSTEDLRVALQRYRSFFGRLLST
ncbi:MAG: hypothetical protein ICV67_00495 [Thermoleophilia bacterium]|nr:hypothetical protein [Thermoleophilia bacterium]